MTSRLWVLIAGGGVAGLDALLALRDLDGDRAQLRPLSSEAEFVYRPMAIGTRVVGVSCDALLVAVGARSEPPRRRA